MEKPSNNSSFSANQREVTLGLVSAVGGVSVLLCSAGLLLVVFRKLYSQLPYRLASFQAAAGLLSGIVYVLEAPLFARGDLQRSDFFCKSVAFLIQCSHLVKLFVTACLTFHLFAFAVCYKDAKKLEVVYVTLSIAIPLLMSVLPWITGSYGQVDGMWCWINPSNTRGIALQLSLFYGPATVAVIFEGISLSLIVGMTLWRARAERRKKTLLVTRRPTKKAIHLDKILPLLVYPIAWSVLILLPTIDGIYGVIRGNSNSPKTQLQYGLMLTNSVCMSAWSVLAGLTLILHVIFTGTAFGPRHHVLSLTCSMQESMDASSEPVGYSGVTPGLQRT